MIFTHSIRIKRLDLDKAIPAASADADFSRLAYYDQTTARIVNGGNPFVSDTVCSKPFEQGLTLRQGVHLHFVLPQAITHYHEKASDILPAPNRWLIKKLKDQKVVDSWVLESDHLAEQSNINGHVNTLLPVNLKENGYEVFKKSTQPFRFVGRLIPAAEYFASSYEADGSYWEDYLSDDEVQRPFTAFAYGNLNFASFYPNCHSVFGFHDLDGTKDHEYQVYGWHAKAEKGISSAYLEALQAFAVSDPAPTHSDWENEFGISPPDAAELKNAKQLLYFGKAEKEDQEFVLGEVKLALGNDVEEALSAFVAEQVRPRDLEEQRKLENQLEAVQFKLLGTQDLDLKPNFEARRHARTFRAHQGQNFLGLELFSPDKAKNADQRQKQLWQLEREVEQSSPLLNELRALIQKANGLWLQYNQQDEQIESRQQLLHSHWQKYLEAAHPPIGMAHMLPNPDDLLVFIRDQSIEGLKGFMENNGLFKVYPKQSDSIPENSIVLDIAEEGQFSEPNQKLSQPWVFEATDHEPVEASPYSLAISILEMLKKIKAGLDKLNGLSLLKGHGSRFSLKFELGQRFYEPGIPTLLLASESFKKSKLNNEAEAIIPDEGAGSEEDLEMPVQSTAKWLSGTGEVTGNDSDFKDFLKGLWSGSTPDFMNELKPDSEVRHPAYMDWGLYFYPAEKKEGITRNYSPEFITRSFNLKQESPEFVAGDDVAYTQAVSRYTGRSPLLAGNARILTDKIRELSDDIQKKQLVKDVLNTAEKYGYLIQGLSGFNLGFVQQKDTLQLPVGDPIAFSDFKEIYKDLKIAEYINGQEHATPVADFDFNPIRAGGAKISQLALIDSFGLKYDLPPKKVAVPETLTPPDGIQAAYGRSLSKIDAFFFPRFMQPVALRAQWLASGTNALGKTTQRQALLSANTQENPITGWVVYSDFYDGLLFFNTHGEQVASLVLEDHKALRRQPPELPKHPVDDYLKQFIGYLEKRQNTFDTVLCTVKKALARIDPAGSSGHEEMALLFGRPLALVRMGLSFEIKGDRLYRMDHAAFKNTIKKGQITPEENNYEQVNIPIRIGDYRKLNDGVILSWKDPKSWQKQVSTTLQEESSLEIQLTSNSLESAEVEKKIIQSHLTEQSLTDGEQHYGLLIDPRAEIHIACGVTPMNVLRIPERYWKQARQALRANLRLGPLMFPQNHVMFDLPEPDGQSWSWLRKNRDGSLSKRPEQQAIRLLQYEKALEYVEEKHQNDWDDWVKKGVLIPGVFGEKDYAYVNLARLQECYYPKSEEENTRLTAPTKMPGSLEMYLTLFEKYGTRISTFSRDPIWMQNELHEGWAQLYPDPEIYKKD